ncbi:hypothetical protein DH2020_043489 [Rehmannia glutinosa]|uniref:Serine carboxypeptidase-like protein n=1 Tax=Rehmannia glutinosa TaxID=99300 RepID=A0ABR0UL82_REHGL
MMNFTNLATWILPWLLLMLIFHSAASQSIVKTLPGYSGNLPFKLETGYVSVGKNEEIELFYYFIESERNPNVDPLVLWITGGPGCSGLCGLAFEVGPIAFDASSFKFNGSLPSFILRPYSWTKIANVIFIDAPVGTGFSYATQADSCYTSDTLSAKDTYTFLRKWLLSHPVFITNDLYISGDSYGGMIIPVVAWEISKGNEAGLEPQMSLKGYSAGNPVTDNYIDQNEKIPYAHGMALISDEHFESAKSSCFGQYVDPDPSNVQCIRALQLIDDDHMNFFISYAWANNPAVQDALYVRKGSIKEWKKCNKSLPYEYNAVSVVRYHQLLSEKKYKALVYSGDHDITVPYLATLKWIRQLNLSVVDDWRPWCSVGADKSKPSLFSEEKFKKEKLSIKDNILTSVFCRLSAEKAENNITDAVFI